VLFIITNGTTIHDISHGCDYVDGFACHRRDDRKNVMEKVKQQAW
jgi:hypothetical protein